MNPPDVQANRNEASGDAHQAVAVANTDSPTSFSCSTRTAIILVLGILVGILVLLGIVIGVTIGTRPKSS